MRTAVSLAFLMEEGMYISPFSSMTRPMERLSLCGLGLLLNSMARVVMLSRLYSLENFPKNWLGM